MLSWAPVNIDVWNSINCFMPPQPISHKKREQKSWIERDSNSPGIAPNKTFFLLPSCTFNLILPFLAILYTRDSQIYLICLRRRFPAIKSSQEGNLASSNELCFHHRGSPVHQHLKSYRN